MLPRTLLAASLSLACATGVLACEPRPRTFQKVDETQEAPAELGPSALFSNEVAEIDLSRGIPEAPAPSLLGGPPGGSFFQLVGAMRDAIEREENTAFFVRFGGARIGWSRAEEIGRLLGRARKAGKSVVCHADAYTNTTAWIAMQGCERIWLSPAGSVETTGLGAQLVFANRLLKEKLGVQVDMLQIGKFKGADEMYTRDEPSPEARESLESTLAAIRKVWLEGFRARGEKALAAAENGPYSPQEALELGLVDSVGYADEARDDARDRGQGFPQLRFGPALRRSSGFAEILRALGGGGQGSTMRRPHVAIVRAVGAITMEAGGGLFGDGSGITERGLRRLIRDLREDDAVKAVVLRIDSPGGSALASDLLWHELMHLRDEKPVVVSIGDMAASGGYYLASAGNRILAEQTSIVGSIGVVGGKLAVGDALEKIGVHVETIAPNPAPGAAARAAYESALSAWDDPTRERVRHVMQSVYDLFLERVARGRGVTVEAVAPAAEGRLFAGQAAKDLGLVDEWGGIERAIEVAKELGGLRAEAPVRLVEEGPGLLDWLASDEGVNQAKAAPQVTIQVDRASKALSSIAPELTAFVASTEPLLHGERTLAALPFAIFLR